MTTENQTIIREALLQLRNEDGIIRPEDVVKAAKSRRHVLHNHFEWDDNVAANAYRLDQARLLIRSVKVVVTVEDREIRASYFVRDPMTPPQVQGYIPISDLQANAAKRRAVVHGEFAKARGALEKAQNLASILAEDIEFVAAYEQIDHLERHAVALMEATA